MAQDKARVARSTNGRVLGRIHLLQALRAERLHVLFDGLKWCARCGLETEHSNGSCRECVKARKRLVHIRQR